MQVSYRTKSCINYVIEKRILLLSEKHNREKTDTKKQKKSKFHILSNF